MLASMFRAVIKGRNPYHLLRLSMLDFPLMLRMKLPDVQRIHPQNNKFAMGVENKATGDSKLNESPDVRGLRYSSYATRTCASTSNNISL